jgi:uncharacterized peroxidase-related enzyme
MYERQQAQFGYVPNYAKVFSHRPEVMGHWANLLSGIRRHVDQRRFELVTLAAAHALRNSYCSLAHSKMLSEFFSSDEILAIVSESDSCPLSAAERAMMEFARKVARDASRITAGDVAKLREFGFTDDEIFDIAATAAARTFFANLCDSLGAEADLDYRETDDELRAALTIGRPISCSEPECLAKPVTTPRPSGAGSTVV